MHEVKVKVGDAWVVRPIYVYIDDFFTLNVSTLNEGFLAPSDLLGGWANKPMYVYNGTSWELVT